MTTICHHRDDGRGRCIDCGEFIDEPGENQQTERLIAAIGELTEAVERAATAIERLEKPPPGWRRLLDEFRQAVSQIPSSIRMRP